MKRLFFFLLLLLIPSQVWAASITNPQSATSMRVEILQKSNIDLKGSADIVELNFSIPQEDEYQRIESLEVYDNNGVCKTEKCSYSFFYDKHGNKKISINWERPETDIEFQIKSIVSVKARKSVKLNHNPEFLGPTALVQSTDQEIADIASKAMGTDFEKVAFLSKWISQNIRYDKVFSDINITAKDILRTRRGVCDEFSNLLVSFLRNLGYHSAVAVGYVYPGRVYGGEQFQPHGWTEVYTESGILADPTWTEVGYLDATHIKFGVFPDSNWIFGNLIARGSLNLEALLGKIDTDIKLLDFEEEPLVEASSGFLDKDVWREYAVIQTNLSADGCILTKIYVKSCVDSGGNEILTKINEDDIVYFCGDRSYFSILKIPNYLQENMKYDCTVNVFPYAGKQELVLLTISSETNDGIKLYTEKTTLTPGEVTMVNAPNSYIFTDKGEFGFNKLNVTASYSDFNVYAYSSGTLAEQEIRVVSEKPFLISLTSPENATVGEAIPVVVNVKNLRQGQQAIEVIFREERVVDNIIGSKDYAFNFTPKSKDDNLIQVFVSTLYYSASKSKMIEVFESPNILTYLIGVFDGMLEWVFELLKSIFK